MNYVIVTKEWMAARNLMEATRANIQSYGLMEGVDDVWNEQQ